MARIKLKSKMYLKWFLKIMVILQVSNSFEAQQMLANKCLLNNQKNLNKLFGRME